MNVKPLPAHLGVDTTEQATSAEGLEISSLPVTPLDRQFGVWPLRALPAVLEQVIWPDGSSAGRKMFAVLDAAKFFDLPLLLAKEGLQHRCLFSGAALEDWGDVAPWLVELSPGSDLLRNLMTRSEQSHHLWDLRPGVFIYGDVSLEDLWRHLRRFTQVRAPQGGKLFFRFWDADTLSLHMRGICEDAHWLHAFGTIGDKPLTFMTTQTESVVLFAVSPRMCGTRTKTPELLPNPVLALMRQERWARFQRRLIQLLQAQHPQEVAGISDADLNEFSNQGYARGFRIEKANFNYVLSAALCQRTGDDLTGFARSIPDWRHLTELDRSYELLKVSKARVGDAS